MGNDFIILLLAAACVAGCGSPAAPSGPRRPVHFEIRNLRIIHGVVRHDLVKSHGQVVDERRYADEWHEGTVVPVGDRGASRGRFVVSYRVDLVKGGAPAAHRHYPHDVFVLVRDGRGPFHEWAGLRGDADTWEPESIKIEYVGYARLDTSGVSSP